VKCGSRLYNTVGNILALFVRNLLKIRVRDYELLVSDESDDLVRMLEMAGVLWMAPVKCGTCDSGFCTCYTPVLAQRFAYLTVARGVMPLLLTDTAFLWVVLFIQTALRMMQFQKNILAVYCFSLMGWRGCVTYVILNVTYRIRLFRYLHNIRADF